MQQRPEQAPAIHWRRAAIVASGVITALCAIRLLGDAAGIARATTPSYALAAISWFVVMLVANALIPWYAPGTRANTRPQRLYLGAQVLAVGAMMQFLVMYLG